MIAGLLASGQSMSRLLSRVFTGPLPVKAAKPEKVRFKGKSTGKTYPMYGAREIARRKRQLDAGILKPNSHLFKESST